MVPELSVPEVRRRAVRGIEASRAAALRVLIHHELAIRPPALHVAV